MIVAEHWPICAGLSRLKFQMEIKNYCKMFENMNQNIVDLV